MVPALVSCSVILSLAVVPAPSARGPSDEALAAYREASEKAGRDPEANVRLALWCEAHELPAERLRHLNVALEADPRHPTARGLSVPEKVPGTFVLI